MWKMDDAGASESDSPNSQSPFTNSFRRKQLEPPPAEQAAVRAGGGGGDEFELFAFDEDVCEVSKAGNTIAAPKNIAKQTGAPSTDELGGMTNDLRRALGGLSIHNTTITVDRVEETFGRASETAAVGERLQSECSAVSARRATSAGSVETVTKPAADAEPRVKIKRPQALSAGNVRGHTKSTPSLHRQGVGGERDERESWRHEAHCSTPSYTPSRSERKETSVQFEEGRGRPRQTAGEAAHVAVGSAVTPVSKASMGMRCASMFQIHTPVQEQEQDEIKSEFDIPRAPSLDDLQEERDRGRNRPPALGGIYIYIYIYIYTHTCGCS